jgi:serine/threonine protein phosphatase PrpC
MPAYTIQFCQFGIEGGVRIADTERIALVEPKSLFASDSRKGNLYILVEQDHHGSSGKEASLIALRMFQKSFYDDTSLSVTSSLRAAMRAANKSIYHYNLNVPSNKKAYIGVTCAVLKGNDLFVAQVIPSQAYVLTEGKLRALPVHPSWNPVHSSVAPFLKSGALGSSLFVEPELYRCPLRSNDSFLLCSSTIAQILRQQDVEQIVQHQDIHEALELVYALCKQYEIQDALACMVKVTLKSREVQESSQSVAKTRRQSLLGPVGGWFDALTRTEKQRQRNQRTTRTRREKRYSSRTLDPTTILEPPPPQPNLPVSPIPKPQELNLGVSLSEHYERMKTTRPRTSASIEAPSSRLGERSDDERENFSALPISQRSRDLSTLPPPPQPGPYRTHRRVRPWIDMTWQERVRFPFGYLAETMVRLVKDPSRIFSLSKPEKQRHSSEDQDKPHFPWLLLLALGLFVALLLLYGTNLARQSAEQQNLEYLEQARQSLIEMRQSSDQVFATQKLELAEQALDQVRSSSLVTVTNPVLWLPFKELESEYERGLGAIQQLTYFEQPIVLANHPLPNGQFADVVVPSLTSAMTDTFLLETLKYIYVLDGDKNNARIYRIPREGGIPQAFLSPDDMVQNVQVGSLRAIAWRMDSVVSLDQTTNTFGYYFYSEGVWNYMRLGGSEVWAPLGRIDLETYEGNLYIWGAEPSEVVKFTSGHYGDIPQLWLDAVSADNMDLGLAVDMGIDGKIYLLFPDGKISVFHLGKFERDIIPDSITPPITAVTRMEITGSSEEGSVFLLDTLNERVIQIDKMTGHVVQQMKVRPNSQVRLNQLVDMSVDGRSGRPVIYLVNGSQIIRTELPSPPQSFEQFNQR